MVGVSSSGEGLRSGEQAGGGGRSSVVGGGASGAVGTGGGRFSSVGSEFESKPNRLLEKWKPFRLVEWSKSWKKKKGRKC